MESTSVTGHRCDNKVIHHSSYELYLHHMAKEHGVGVYLYKCDKVCKDRRDLKVRSELFEEHEKSCLDTFQQFPCKFCNTTWASHLSLELHFVENHEKKMCVTFVDTLACIWVKLKSKRSKLNSVTFGENSTVNKTR